ncbi:MAG: hypothetical protein WBB01_06200 [Phormidesmis sp.]
MSTTVLPQLQEIESDLVTQEETLTARLEELRGQLRGVRAVIPMFEGTSTPTVESPAPPTEGTVETVPPAATQYVEEPTPAVASPAPKAIVKRKQATPKKAAAEKAGTQKRTTTEKATAKNKKDGRTASWQKYTRPGVKNESIPDAVRLILETQPEKDFKIAEVMDALFQEGMPKAQYGH